MRRIALLTTIALGIPVAALAQPGDRARVEIRDRDRDIGIEWRRDRYDRYDDYRRGPAWRDYRGRWVSFGRGYNASNQRQFIHVSGSGRFRMIRIEGVRGEPVVQKVLVEFENGSHQAIELDTSLRRGVGEVIDLNGRDRRISRIVVYTDPRSRGAYAVYGA